MPKKKRKDKFTGTLADKLKGLSLPTEDAPEPGRPEPPRSAPKTPEPPPEPVAPDLEAMSDDDLFAHVVDEITPETIFRGKYIGDGPRVRPEPEAKPSSEQLAEEAIARAQVAELREEMTFARAVQGVERMEDGKYYVPKPRHHIPEARPYSSEPPTDLIADPLPKTGPGLSHVEELTRSQKALLERARAYEAKGEMPTLNVRGDSVEDALRQLELFVHQAWREGTTYVRVVHGRGVGSEGKTPVLKPSVLHWLEGPGHRYARGYAPELLPNRDYGSLLVAIARRPEPNT